MASKNYEIAYKLAAQLDKKYNETFAKAENIAAKSAKKIKKIFTSVVAAVGVTALVATSTSAFVDFENSMNEVFTLLPGITSEAMDEMTRQVKQASIDMGVLPEETVPALYQALSAGVPKDNVFDFLETANKAASGGVTSLETAVDGLSTVVNSYGGDIIDAAKASDLMFTAVKAGKTTFEELSSSLYNVLPSASASGVAFEDITAALATMTSQGIPTSAATNKISKSIEELSDRGSSVGKVFEKLSGKSFKDFIAGGGNMQDALQILEEYSKKTNVGINELFSSTEAGQAALALTGNGTAKFTESLEAMANAAGATETAFNTMENGIGDVIDDIKVKMAVYKLAIGELGGKALLGVIGIFEKVGNSVSSTLDKNSNKVWILQSKFNLLRNKILDLTSSVSSNFEPTLNNISEKVVPKVINILTFLINVATNFVDFFATNWGNISTSLGKIGNNFLDLAGNVGELVGTIFDSLIPSIDSTGGVISRVIPIAVDTINGLLSSVTNIVDFMTNNWTILESIIIGVGLAFGTIKLGLLIADIVKCTIKLKANTIAWIASTKAKALDKAETIALKAMYAKDMVVSLAKSTAEIAKNTTAWVVSKAQLVAQKVGLVALKGVQLISTGVTTAMTAAQWALNAAFIASPIGWVVLAIGALIAISILLYKNWDIVKAKTLELWAGMLSFVNGISEKFPIIGNVITLVTSYITTQFENIKQVFNGVIDFVTGVFTGNWSLAWEGVVSAFGGIFSGIVEMVKLPLNGVISLVNGVVDSINGINISIPEWVPGLGGKTYNLGIPKIPMFAKGTNNSPDTFIAGEKGAELVTGREHSKIFTALETGNIFGSLQKLASVLQKLPLFESVFSWANKYGGNKDNGGGNGEGGKGAPNLSNLGIPVSGGPSPIPKGDSPKIQITYSPNVQITGSSDKEEILSSIKNLLEKDKTELVALIKSILKEEENKKVRLSNG